MNTDSVTAVNTMHTHDEFMRMRARAEKAEALVYELRNMINLLLDQTDYTSAACRVNEMIGAVLGKNLIDLARRIAKGGD